MPEDHLKKEENESELQAATQNPGQEPVAGHRVGDRDRVEVTGDFPVQKRPGGFYDIDD